MPDDRDPLPLRPSVSPWLLGGLALGWLVVLAVTLKQVGLVVTAWVASTGLVVLASTRRRRTPPAAPAAPAAPATALAPSPASPPSPAAAGVLPVVLTPENAATLLQVQSDEVVTAIQKQQIPGNRIGEHYRMRTESLLTWLDGPYRPQDHPPDGPGPTE
ncbi:hypothetical protein [Paractinoplanes maris]|uniref:hypothetical protein n=1 Tax=Paractinoplanes maris TaxID=1734446 RepID=UPI0020217B60|nr:hypothetical protein [Actinoplanes maris]